MLNLLGVLPYWSLGPWPKEAFMIGGLPLQIHSFGLCVAIGLLLTFSISSWRAENKYGISGEAFQNFGIWMVLIGWPFSHIFNVLFYEPHVLKDDPMELFRVWGSISSYGGLLGGIIAFFGYTFFKKYDRMTWADMATFSLAVPWFFGRIGCATVHDHPGDLAKNFWLWEKLGGEGIWPLAIDFPARVNLTAGARHDLGFYEAIWWGMIVLVLFWLDRKPRPLGFFAAVLPIMYAPGRFMFDFLRVPPEMGGDARYFGMTPAQYLSIGIFIVGWVMFFKVRNNPPLVWTKYVPPGQKKADAAAAAAAAEVSKKSAKDDSTDEDEDDDLPPTKK